MTNKQKIEKFIDYVKSNKYSDKNQVYVNNEKPWTYYYSVCGFIDGKYFCVYLMKYKRHRHTTEIVDISECKSKLHKILIQFKLLKNE